MQSSALRTLLSFSVASLSIVSCGPQPNEAHRAQTPAAQTTLDPRTPYRRQPPPVVPRLVRERPSDAVQRAANSTRPLASSYNTYDYVLKTLDFDETDAVARRGFNPDGHTSTAADNAGCNRADFQSTMTPALNLAQCASGTQFCTGGVDNALPELMDVFDNSVGLPFRSHANTWIRQGRSYWLMRITYVDDKSNDPEVEAHFYRGFARSSSCNGQLSGNGEFNVDNAYLATPGDISQPLYRFAGQGGCMKNSIVSAACSG